MAAGGALIVLGEQSSYTARNNSIFSLISSAGGGTVGIGGTNGVGDFVVTGPFTGPITVSNMSFNYAGSFNSAGSGAIFASRTWTTAFTYYCRTGAYWAPGTMVNASAGTLVAILDTNWLADLATQNTNHFASNVATYLATSSSIITAPVINSITPNTGDAAGGVEVTISGIGLSNANAVTVGGVACGPITNNTATSLICTTSAHAPGSASVEVTTASGTNSSNTLFNYVVGPAKQTILLESMGWEYNIGL